MAKVPNFSEKEKTARLVESLSRHQQVELLAQALLREYMHRRGLRNTLHTFDMENPRDERTISSRALMRHLLNIPAEGRMSRLQPTASSSSAKPQAPTFMEELCSYRLTKRDYTSAAGKQGSEQRCDQEDDPSDVELCALHTALDKHQSERALGEERQREYLELLAAEEAYQRRKKDHKGKRHKSHDKGRHRERHRARGHADSSDDEAGIAAGSSDESITHGRGPLDVDSSDRSKKTTSALSDSRRSSTEIGTGGASAVVAAVGSRWQPPAIVSQVHDSHHIESEGASSHTTGPATRKAAQHGLCSDSSDDNSDHENEFDPFGDSAANQRALMARIRAESERWPLYTHDNAPNAHGSSTNSIVEGGGGSMGSLGAPPGALSALSGRDAGFRGLGSLRSTQPVQRVAGGLTAESTTPFSPTFGSISSTAPAGASAGVAALRMRGSSTSISGASTHISSTDLTKASYIGSAPYSSILVKHRGTPQGDNHDTGEERPLHSYDRTAVPLSSALAGSSSSGGIDSSSGTRSALRSPPPQASMLNEPHSSVVLRTPSRSPVRDKGGASGSGGGSSGLRHGIGFRTSSVSADGIDFTSPSSRGVSDVASAAKPNRKERRVKLLVD